MFNILIMENIFFLATDYKYLILASLLAGIVIGFTISSLFESFGPNSQELRDPFEEHEN